MNQFSSSKIKNLFLALNGKLAREGARGEVYLVGGAVMCIAFQARAATKDLDGVFAPAALIRTLAREIADEEDLPTDWLNDGVKGFLSGAGTFNQFLELSNLAIFTATPEYLLALKCLAMRLGAEFHDESDVRYLLRHLNIGTYESAINTISAFYPLDRIPQKTLYALEEILSTAN